MSDAFLWVDSEEKKLYVSYGNSQSDDADDVKIAELKLNTEEEMDLVNSLLADINLWHNFLASMSAALTQQLGTKVD